jgi:ArsR family transcriptional regulator, virulence genes transcriptional regulator
MPQSLRDFVYQRMGCASCGLLVSLENANMSSMKMTSPPQMRKIAVLDLQNKAEEVSALLASMANARRLMILCRLIEGEKSVGELVETVGLSQSALSQHLSKLRAAELVTTRRNQQTIYYSLASDHVRQIMQTLYEIYCAPQ